jgi:hypothetical protein
VDGRGSDGVVFYSGAVASGLHKGHTNSIIVRLGYPNPRLSSSYFQTL